LLKIRIVTSGKDKDRWITEGVDHYGKLLARYANLEFRIIRDVKVPSSLSPKAVKSRQSPRYKKEIKKGVVVALSDRGKRYDSAAFAKFLERVQTAGGDTLQFLIGGPYGLDESLIEEADYVLSLSKMTFSHQLVRLILLEQLYRGFSILSGTAYHK
jgi:23S rRNA (pseudouridine1915-N3)-methyltransferase